MIESSSETTASPPSTCRGWHLLVELWQARRLDEVAHVERALRAAAEVCGATVLDVHLHRFGQGGGVTGVALLAESHVSIHTWPEHAYAAIDLFVCGTCDPRPGVAPLLDAFVPERHTTQLVERGVLREGEREKGGEGERERARGSAGLKVGMRAQEHADSWDAPFPPHSLSPFLKSPRADDPDGVYDAGDVAQQRQQDVEPEVEADTFLEKDAQGRQDDG